MSDSLNSFLSNLLICAPNQVFQEEIQGAGVCLSFLETLQRENIESEARRAALTIQASTAKVILIFAWFTDVIELFLQLEKLNVRNRNEKSSYKLLKKAFITSFRTFCVVVIVR